MNENTKLMERKALALKAHVEGTAPEPPRGTKKGPHQGMQRHVFVDKRNGWVFKISKGPRGYNEKEYQTYLNGKDNDLFKEGSPFRLPKTMLIHDVIVMEYVDGQHATYQEWGAEQWQLEAALGCGDIHYQNVLRTKDGLTYVIDMAW